MAWIGEDANSWGEEANSWGEGKPMIVDVGGGLGQLFKYAITAIPGASAKQCVLQDHNEVIEEAKSVGDPVIKGAVMMEHNFHTDQPVKGLKMIKYYTKPGGPTCAVECAKA